MLIVEIINTAFKTTIERISSEQHILSKKSERSRWYSSFSLIN
nr:hypothetical protein [Wolbachia endosymbiont of Trichogramma pretiosum]